MDHLTPHNIVLLVLGGSIIAAAVIGKLFGIKRVRITWGKRCTGTDPVRCDDCDCPVHGIR